MEQLKSCVCKKAFYCSKECQTKDWKTHKPSCPPFTIRDSPGKGRGLFATRQIKEGQIISDEYPLITLQAAVSLEEFKANIYPNIDQETKAKILQLNDPSNAIKTLDTVTIEALVRKNTMGMAYWMEAPSDEVQKIYRIIAGNDTQICGQESLYSNTTQLGLYKTFSLINHACVPNATSSWVMGDFLRHQIRAIMPIEKGQEILVSYWCDAKLVYGSRETRQQYLLEIRGFWCECSECSLEGKDLEQNERMRAEVRETEEECSQRMEGKRFDTLTVKDVKKTMKLDQRRVKLIQGLDIRAGFSSAMIDFYLFAVLARKMNISCVNDPDIYKQEAWKYAKMCGDSYIHRYHTLLRNYSARPL